MSGSLRWFVNGKFVFEVGNDLFLKVKKKKSVGVVIFGVFI